MSNNNVRLIVGGFECAKWDAVSIDSDLMIPADAWSLTLFNPPSDPLPPSVIKGAVVEIYHDKTPILKGTIDRITDNVTKQGYRLSVSGRDVVGLLLDSSVPLSVKQQITLEDVVGKYVFADFGAVINDVIVDKNVNYSKTKTAVEPSESIWDAVVKAAEAVGQYVWARADGAIVVGNPFTRKQPKTPRLVLMRGSNRNNVLSVDYTDDITSQYSIVTVLGQDTDTGASLSAQDSQEAVFTGQETLENSTDTPEYSGTSKQPLPYLRRKIVLDTLADNDNQAAKRARKIMQDGNLSAHSLTAEVAGWTCPTGEVWATGWTVHYQSDVTRKAANGQWVIMGRTLKIGRDGRTTQLRLKRKQDWMQPVAPSAQRTEEQDYPSEYGG